MKEKAQRFNDQKLKWSLVDYEAMKDMVRVLEFGALKYDAHNWRKGLPVTEVIESLLRHIYAYLEGEDNDPESKLPHTGHIMCNAMFLSYIHSNKPEFDDRYKPESKAVELTDTYEGGFTSISGGYPIKDMGVKIRHIGGQEELAYFHMSTNKFSNSSGLIDSATVVGWRPVY